MVEILIVSLYLNAKLINICLLTKKYFKTWLSS